MDEAIENTLHTLKDIRTTQDVVDYNIKRLTELSKRLNIRISGLEQRIDRFIEKGGTKNG